MDFQTRYDKLNIHQRQAVDSINGPLLVIAGPGTGKTELLSMRAAQILRQTDTLPSNILCLTFTDSGAVNMRERLRQIIGEDAYKVAIHTFHNFGTEIIATNRDYFFRGSEAQPVDELTQHQIMTELFSALDWRHPLSVKNGDNFVYLKDTLSVISECKRSGLTPDELRHILDSNQRIFDKINSQITEVFSQKISKSTAEKLAPLAEAAATLTDNTLPPGVTSYASVLAPSIARAVTDALDTNSTKPITAWKNSWCEKDEQGNMILKDSRAIEKLRACVDIYESYTNILRERILFDYDDMILEVLAAMKNHPDLLANLQERYQYIMIDEFQDTNLAQLRLLFNLTGEDKEPNVMAVGDDDQAIFSFQGADISNIKRFREQYRNSKIIVLTDNYRSHADILTASRAVITQGADRLERSIPELSKQLTAHASPEKAEVNVREFSSPLEERSGVAKQIAEMIQHGTAPENIAVLARCHQELIELLPHLAEQGIAVNYERQDDVLEQPLIRSLELVARTVVALHNNQLDTANSLLPELVAHSAFNFTATDIWKLSLHAYKNNSLWLESMLTNSVFMPFAEWLLEQAKNISNLPLEEQIDQLLGLEMITSPGGQTTENQPSLAAYYLSSEILSTTPDAYLTMLESLRTLRDKLRDHYVEQTPTLENLIQFIDLHRSLGTRITTNRAQASHLTGAITLMSAHKAKGLEFPHVYIIGATDGAWGEKARSRSRLIRYPANLQLAPAGNNYDERLRLFFVAMTRAKTTLSISYAKTDHNGKDSLIASFLSHHSPDNIPASNVAESQNALAADWRNRLATPMTTDLRAILAPKLERYKLAATHLNAFLDVSRGGPQTFLFNNLLHFPSAKAPNANYGTAIHATLQYAHMMFRADSSLPPQEQLLDYFTKQLSGHHLSPEDFATFNDKGRTALTAFLDAKQHTFTATQLPELNFSSQEVVLDDARLTGKLDLVDIDSQQKTIFVTDYKTGKPADSWRGHNDTEKIKLHKYRQQLMFYQLLVESSRDYSDFTFTGARLQFVEPDMKTGDILSLEDNFSREELTEFTRLINVVWRKITTLDLPDISGYSADYKGMVQFENDLLTGEI
mgnify:FL=1